MDLNSFLQVGIVGVALSAGLEYVNSKFTIGSLANKAIVVGASLALGAGFYFIQGTPLLDQAVGILGVATAFYAFFVK